MNKKWKQVLSCFLILLLLPIVSLGTTASAKSTDSLNGHLIEIGEYPQTEVTDENLLVELNGLELNWQSYEYLNEQKERSDYMKFADVSYDGNKYRAVVFSEYRPDFYFINGDSVQKQNGYETDQVYWFRYEPLKWKVLDETTGLVQSLLVIDSQAYNDVIYNIEDDFYCDPDCTISAYDYTSSSLRVWLNRVFYNQAFNEKEKQMIHYTQIDATESDKVYLLSFDQVKYYFFYSDITNRPLIYDDEIFRTDYAKVQGNFCDNEDLDRAYAYWMLGADSKSGGGIHGCSIGASIISGQTVYHSGMTNNSIGVRPVMRIDKSSGLFVAHDCTEWTVDVPATCEKVGLKSRYCYTCGITEYADIDIVSHSDTDNDGKCDMCKKSMFYLAIKPFLEFLSRLFARLSEIFASI